VDWPLIMGPGPDTPAPKVVEQSVRGQLAVLLSAFDDILALENRDAILRQAVEVARVKIGLARAAIFLFDGTRNMMLGSWGSDLRGALVLMWTPLWNGYPLLHSDSGTYLASAMNIYAPVDRSIGYGLFIRTAGLINSLWFVIFIQALGTSYLLFRTAELLLPSTPNRSWLALCIVLATALTTTLSMRVGRIMPDFFACWLFLAACIFVFTNQRHERFAAAFLFALALLAGMGFDALRAKTFESKMFRNALIDFEPCETADEDPVRTEPWHGLHERVVRCKERAAETCTKPVRPGIFFGANWLTVVPSPSCPRTLSPQAQTLPSESSASTWKSPALT
jgi:hypothetical protein